MAQVTFAHQRAPRVTALGKWRTAATSIDAGRGRIAVCASRAARRNRVAKWRRQSAA